MALIRIDHVPETVKVNITLNLIVPEPGAVKGVPVRERKTLYLLHGLGDDASAWQRFTSIETVVSAYGLVVVMPTVGRSFYVDQPNGQAYYTYLVDELPRYLADVFGLMPGRDDTLIAGLSMGGYGALKAAMLHPELYRAAGLISGVLSFDILEQIPQGSLRAEMAWCFGDLDRVKGGEHDPAVWLRRASRNPAALPRLYVTCGRQDELLKMNRAFADECRSLGIYVEYQEEDGKHDWFFADSALRRFLTTVLGPLPSE